HVGLVRLAGPDLLARELPLVAHELGARLQGRQVTAGARLAVALTPDELAGERARDVLAPLLLAAALEQGRNEHLRTLDDAAVRRSGPVELLANHRFRHHVERSAHTAVGARHRAVQEAGRERALTPGDRL